MDIPIVADAKALYEDDGVCGRVRDKNGFADRGMERGSIRFG